MVVQSTLQMFVSLFFCLLLLYMLFFKVDYNATVDQLEEHFRGCGSIDRITILLDKYNGNPKG